MSVEIPNWPRSQYQPGGGEAYVFFAVYGEFSTEVRVSGARYRTAGVPEGFSVRRLDRTQSEKFPFESAAIGDLLRPQQRGLFQSIQEAAECTIIQGTIPDPADLNYLRDTVGLAMFFLEHGGIAVMDPQQVKLYDPERWRVEIFDPQPPQLSRHAIILVSDETTAPPAPPGTEPVSSPTGRRWIHTRGMRKFGRPDLSVHNVPREQELPAIDLCNRFIQLQAQGTLIPEGEEIRMKSLPAGLVCRHGGNLEDPDFNNVHVDIRWPIL